MIIQIYFVPLQSQNTYFINNSQKNMKRISLLLFGAMIALGVRAQQLYVKSDWKLDSVITTSQDGQLLTRMVCTYDSQDLLLRVDGQDMNGGILYDTKSLHTYNDQGMTA